MTLDHKSPLNHRPIQQGESTSTKCKNKDSQEKSNENLFQEMLPKVPLIATRWLQAKMKQQTLKASLQTFNEKIQHPVYQQYKHQPRKREECIRILKLETNVLRKLL